MFLPAFRRFILLYISNDNSELVKGIMEEFCMAGVKNMLNFYVKKIHPELSVPAIIDSLNIDTGISLCLWFFSSLEY
jgi:hypothetical protein